MEIEVIEVALVVPPPQSFGNAASEGKNRKALDEGRVWVMMKLWQLNCHGYQQFLVTVCVSSESSGQTQCQCTSSFHSICASCFTNLMGCSRALPVYDRTGGGHIFNVNCENV